MQYAKALKFVMIGTIGTAAMVLLMTALVRFGVPQAEATPVIAKGKPCNACHTSPTPNKGDLKK